MTEEGIVPDGVFPAAGGERRRVPRRASMRYGSSRKMISILRNRLGNLPCAKGARRLLRPETRDLTARVRCPHIASS
jgi:hypothetical protein